MVCVLKAKYRSALIGLFVPFAAWAPALRLARLFRTSHQFWLNLHMQFESETLLSAIGDELARITPVPDAA